MAYVAAAAAIIGAGVSAYGAIQQGKAANNAAKYNAQVLENNAQMARDRAALEEIRARQVGKLSLSKARAAIGASGVTAEGSPLDALSFSAQNAEQDALLVRHAGEVEATNYTNDAALQRYQGKQAKKASYLSAGSELLSGVGRAAGYYA